MAKPWKMWWAFSTQVVAPTHAHLLSLLSQAAMAVEPCHQFSALCPHCLPDSQPQAPSEKSFYLLFSRIVLFLTGLTHSQAQHHTHNPFNCHLARFSF